MILPVASDCNRPTNLLISQLLSYIFFNFTLLIAVAFDILNVAVVRGARGS